MLLSPYVYLYMFLCHGVGENEGTLIIKEGICTTTRIASIRIWSIAERAMRHFAKGAEEVGIRVSTPGHQATCLTSTQRPQDGVEGRERLLELTDTTMPLKKGKKNVGANIRELHKGPMYKKNVKKFGKAKANKIAIAAAMSQSRKKK
jgi:hypothetical protein